MTETKADCVTLHRDLTSDVTTSSRLELLCGLPGPWVASFLPAHGLQRCGTTPHWLLLTLLHPFIAVSNMSVKERLQGHNSLYGGNLLTYRHVC